MALTCEEIADRMEIEQLLVRYCHAIDSQIQHAISTSLVEIDGDTASARTVCHCPVVLDRGTGEPEMFFQGLWYVDELVRTPAGWRIAKRAERDYFHNMPPDFRFG